MVPKCTKPNARTISFHDGYQYQIFLTIKTLNLTNNNNNNAPIW